MTPAEYIRHWREMITEAEERTEASFNDAFAQARRAGQTEFTHQGQRPMRRLDESVSFLRAKTKFLANPTGLTDDEYRTLWQHRDKLSPTALQRIRGIMARRRRETPSAAKASQTAPKSRPESSKPAQAPNPSKGSANVAPDEVGARVRSLGRHLYRQMQGR